MTQAKLDARTKTLLNAPPLPLLLSMASPNAMAFFLQAGVSMAEVWYIGQLGTESLASIALVFPLLMLVMMMSGGALGGAVTSSIARALGAGNVKAAETLVWHAVIVALSGAALFLIAYLLFGYQMLLALGGIGAVLENAHEYATWLFVGGISLWMTNTFSAVFRGMGNMQFPARLMMLGALIQVPLSGALILGWGGLPVFGILGAAISTILVSLVSLTVLLVKLGRGKETVGLHLANFSLKLRYFQDILKVALPAALSPVLTVASVLVLTGLVGQFGVASLAGFGIGSRLEFLLVPMVFGIGAAMTAMVGVNVGAGQLDRAESIGWMGGSLAAVLTGLVGCITAIWPGLWVGLYTDDAAAFEIGSTYMRIVGPCYAFQGLGLALYFASQGAGKVTWPVLATIGRFVVTVGGATLAVGYFDAPIDVVFYFAGAGMLVYGIATAVAIKLGAWRA